MNGPQGGIAGILNTILQVLGIRLEPWMAPAAVVAGALVLSPLLWRNQKTAKARRVIGRLATATTAAERASIEAEALALVDGNADGLASLADLALQRGRTGLVRTCLERIEALGGRPGVVARLRRELDGDFPRTVDEVVVRIEFQLEAGLTVAAAETLARGERTWPGEPVWDGLRGRVGGG